MEKEILQIEDMISHGNYEAAKGELPSLVEAAGEDVSVSGVFLELLILVNCFLVNDTVARKVYFDYYKVCRKEGLANFRFTRSVNPIAESLFKARYYEEALEIYKDGIKLAEELADQEHLNLFEKKINEVRETIESLEQFQQSLCIDESTSSRSKKKKPPRSPKKEDKVIENTNENEENRVDSQEGEKHALKISNDDSFPCEFEVDLNFKLQTCSKDGNYKGIVKDYFSLPKSFIKTRESQVQNFVQLQALCSSSDSLLTVESVTKHESTLYVVAESVNDLNEHFESVFKDYQMESIDGTWWDFIYKKFWIIFRDVTRGIMFLLSSNQDCGDIALGLYVTSEGRGRLLPSVDPASPSKIDVKDLVGKMLRIICLSSAVEPVIPDDSNFDFLQEYNLPQMLVNMLSSLINYAGKVPDSFLVDHCFFWSKEERIQFIYKMRRLLAKKNIKQVLQHEFVSASLFGDWHTPLHGVYYRVWDKGNPNRSSQGTQLGHGMYRVKPYSREIDIIRYFEAVYNHVGQREYKSERNSENLIEEKLEEGLHSMFSTFYTDVFSSLCNCVATKVMDTKWLKLIASCDYHNDDANENN